MKKMKKSSNKGIALVSVIVIIALLSLLAGTVLNLSYMAYSRKLVEKKNNSNFYAAEAVLDSVKTVLQNGAIEALEDAQISEAEFAVSAFKIITGYDGSNVSANGTRASDVCEEAIDSVRNYLYYSVISETVLNEDGSISGSNLKTDENYVSGGTYTYIKDAITSEANGGNGGEFTIGDIICEEDCVRIEDVYVKYINDEGYVAEINTDIVIRAPHYIDVGDEPLGSYSMFAGSGAEIYTVGQSGTAKALNNMLYLHQEGNVYFGSMTEEGYTMNSLMIGTEDGTIRGDKGKTIFSIEGTNVICNGNIEIQNGCSLVLTGGDGTETAFVQVNGYIVLEDGASLFLAPNVYLMCKGIVTDIEYDTDGKTVKSYTPYTGSGAQSTVSQFYPVTLDYLNDNCDASLLEKYYNAEIDLEELFYQMGGFTSDVENNVEGNNTYLDDRFENLYDTSTTNYAGVYVLNETADSDGWENRTGCEYMKVTCSVVADEWTWNLTSTGEDYTYIYCSSTDTDLDADEKVYYNGSYYDPEFFEVVNVPLLEYYYSNVFSGETELKYVFDGYSLEDEDSYTESTWKAAMESGSYSTWISGFDWTSLASTTYLDRDFYIPNNKTSGYRIATSTDSTGYGAYKVTTSYGTFSVTATKNVAFSPADNYDVTSLGIQFFTALKDVTVRVANGYSAGILLTNNKAAYGENAGVMRVISLLELGDKATGEGVVEGLANDGNPVHDLLEYIGSGYIMPNNANPSYTINDSTCQELGLVDNMFNGGMAAFWSMSTVAGSSQADDNSDDDLVSYDDWNKQ